MEKSDNANTTSKKPDNTRAGGADDTRTTGDHKEDLPEKDTPRGAPQDTRSTSR